MMMQNGVKYDADKSRMDLIPLDIIEKLGRVFTYGSKKYGENTWQELPNFWKRYKAALLRHLAAIDSGELYDQESGLAHIDHALWNLLVLSWGFHHGKGIDIHIKDIEEENDKIQETRL